MCGYPSCRTPIFSCPDTSFMARGVSRSPYQKTNIRLFIRGAFREVFMPRFQTEEGLRQPGGQQKSEVRTVWVSRDQMVTFLHQMVVFPGSKA